MLGSKNFENKYCHLWQIPSKSISIPDNELDEEESNVFPELSDETEDWSDESALNIAWWL